LGNLQTPEKIRNLQRKLYSKAKSEPGFRFYLLYDKVHRTDILEHADYGLAKKAGAPTACDASKLGELSAAPDIGAVERVHTCLKAVAGAPR
jgi:RNA-directed DNA polymerase